MDCSESESNYIMANTVVMSNIDLSYESKKNHIASDFVVLTDIDTVLYESCPSRFDCLVQF